MNKMGYENHLLRKLLSTFVEQTGVQSTVLEQALDVDISGKLETGATFSSVELAPRAGRRDLDIGTNPVSGVLDDEDGLPIVVQVLIKEGLLAELAIFKADGSDIRSLPSPELVRVYDTRDSDPDHVTYLQ